MNDIHFSKQFSGFCKVFLSIPLISCAPNAYLGNSSSKVDIQPPVIHSAEVMDEQSIVFEFDEQVSSDLDDIEVKPDLGIALTESEENRLIVQFSSSQTIGLSYTMRIKVEDIRENSLSFLYEFSGWNPRVPAILINEINPKGSSSTPDCVELFTLSDGNLGGLLFVIGTEEDPLDSFVFPAVEIQEGDYIVIHTKPEGISEEVDEVEEIDASGGRLAQATSRDFWMRDAPGLPGSNGAITLYRNRGGNIIDAVIWSNRDDAHNDDDLGWTSASFPWARSLGLLEEWQASGDIPLPSEAVQVSSSTATRSLCRGSVPIDSNSPDDWHTVPTRGQTFGAVNIDDVHKP